MPNAVRAARYIARALGGVPVHIVQASKACLSRGRRLCRWHCSLADEAGSADAPACRLHAPRSHARAALPLTRQVLDNMRGLARDAAWTGPLLRGDYGVDRRARERLRPLPREFLRGLPALASRLRAHVLATQPAARSSKSRIASKAFRPLEKSKGRLSFEVHRKFLFEHTKLNKWLARRDCAGSPALPWSPSASITKSVFAWSRRAAAASRIFSST